MQKFLVSQRWLGLLVVSCICGEIVTFAFYLVVRKIGRWADKNDDDSTAKFRAKAKSEGKTVEEIIETIAERSASTQVARSLMTATESLVGKIAIVQEPIPPPQEEAPKADDRKKKIASRWEFTLTGILTGILERLFFTWLVAVAGVTVIPSAAVGWIAIKGQIHYNIFSDKSKHPEGRREIARGYVGILSSVVSMFFALLGGHFWHTQQNYYDLVTKVKDIFNTGSPF
jgi:hypothetical protein